MAKKKIIIPAEDTQKWLCTFNDLMTLLLTFFVLLLSMSSLDAKKIKDLQETMINALGFMEEGRQQEETIVEKLFRLEEIGSRMKVFKNIIPPADDDARIEEQLREDQLSEDLLRDFIAVREEGLDVVSEDEVFNQFQELIRDQYYEPGISILRMPRGVVLRLADGLLFESGSAEIIPKASDLLDSIALIIKQTAFTIYVEGHTDAMPIRTARYPSNWELSVSRAVAVAQHMIERSGIEPQRIGVSGYADIKPLAPNDSELNRSKNRRIEIIVSRY
jgi:chemotaxis protein MotB